MRRVVLSLSNGVYHRFVKGNTSQGGVAIYTKDGQDNKPFPPFFLLREKPRPGLFSCLVGLGEEGLVAQAADDEYQGDGQE